MKKNFLFALIFMGAIGFQACNNSSQQSTDTVEAAEDSNENAATDVKEDDSEFVVAAANGGMMEIESGKVASEKAASAEVKAFGSKMVADHTKASGELKTLATAKGLSLPASLGEDEKKHLDEMAKLSGAEFDKHYMDMMVNDHDKTVSMFEDAARNAKDAEIKAFAEKTLPVLKEHQAAAKALHDKM